MVREEAERVMEYLRREGPATPRQIAKALGLDHILVMKVLGELEKEGKVYLHLDSLESYLKRFREASKEADELARTWKDIRRGRNFWWWKAG